jgi:hypothetical protein
MTGEIAAIMIIVGIALLVAGGRTIGHLAHRRNVRACRHESVRHYTDNTVICSDCDEPLIEAKHVPLRYDSLGSPVYRHQLPPEDTSDER